MGRKRNGAWRVRRAGRGMMVLSVGVLLGPSSLGAQGGYGADAPGIEVTELREGVYLFRAPSTLDRWTSSNSVAFVGEDGVVLYDTNTLPSTSRMVLEELRRITEQPVRFLINSHWRQDHWSGNQVYADSMTFRTGGREFRLYSVGGDATGSTVLHVPEEDLLVTGDALPRQEDGRGGQSWTMNSYDVAGWLRGLDLMASFEAGTIIPGQGPAFVDDGYLDTTRDLYASIIRQTHEALRAGHVMVSDIQGEVDLEEFRSRCGLDTPELNATVDQIAASLIRRVVQAARHGGGTPGD